MPITDPSQIASNVGWGTGKVGVTDDGSGNVTAWANQNGAVNLDGTAGTAPRTGVDSLNGHNVLTFNSGSIYTTSDLVTGGQPFTVALYFSADDNANTGTEILVGNREFTNWWVNTAFGNLFANAGSGVTLAGYAADTYYRLIVTFDGLTSAFWLDGAKTTFTGTPGINSAAGISIGGSGGAGGAFFNDCKVAAWSMFNAAISDTEATDLDDWMVQEFTASTSITSVNGVSPIPNLGTNIPIIGTGLQDPSVTSATFHGTTQTAFNVTSDTAATFTCVRPPNLSYGVAATFAIGSGSLQKTMEPQTGWSYVTITSLHSVKAKRIDAGQTFDLEIGDQVAYQSSVLVGGQPATVTVNDDGTVTATLVPAVFSWELFDPDTNDWGTTGVFTAQAQTQSDVTVDTNPATVTITTGTSNVEVTNLVVKTLSRNRAEVFILTANKAMPESGTDEPINGIADYNDAATSITPITLTADTWTTLTNDGAGTFTNEQFLPSGVTRMMDTANGQFLFDELNLGDSVTIRNDFTVTPSTNNQEISLRYVLGTGGAQYTLEKRLGRLDSGDSIPYRFSLESDMIYMGDLNTKDNPVTLQIRTSGGGTVVNAGTAFTIVKR